ncbi:hypothetical protein PSYJA_46066, partial [Pseudomonas syringae pv. japonica str. M301072]
LSGQVITVQVTAGDTGTSDVDFSRNAQWHWLHLCV